MGTDETRILKGKAETRQEKICHREDEDEDEDEEEKTSQRGGFQSGHSALHFDPCDVHHPVTHHQQNQIWILRNVEYQPARKPFDPPGTNAFRLEIGAFPAEMRMPFEFFNRCQQFLIPAYGNISSGLILEPG